IKQKLKNRQLPSYLLRNSRQPVHVLRLNHTSVNSNHLPNNFQFSMTSSYSHNRRTAILDGVTVRAQRLQEFSRQLNEFTTTRRRVSSLVSGINGKTKTTGWRHSVPTAKRGSIPKSVSTLTKKGFAM